MRLLWGSLDVHVHQQAGRGFLTPDRLKSKLLKTRSTGGSNPQSRSGEPKKDDCGTDARRWPARARRHKSMCFLWVFFMWIRQCRYFFFDVANRRQWFSYRCSSLCRSAWLHWWVVAQKWIAGLFWLSCCFQRSFPFSEEDYTFLSICNNGENVGYLYCQTHNSIQ